MTMAIETRPLPNDVLCGKDKRCQLHPGNRIYRDLIEEKAVLYATVESKHDKMNTTQEIVATMKNEHGARFLRSIGEDAWEEISHQQARDKTSHALRFCASQRLQTAAAAATNKTKKRRGCHRRTVSRDSGTLKPPKTPSAHVRRYTLPSTGEVLNNDLFERQQAILLQMQEGHHHHHPQHHHRHYDHHHHHHHHHQDDVEDDEPIPIAASSADLDVILSQPLNAHDWDGLFQM